MDVLIERSKTLLFTRVDHEYLAVDGEDGFCYSFNEPAWRVWVRLAERQTLKTLCAGLCSEFKVEPATCEEEVRSLLADFQTMGLVAFHGG